MRLPDLINNPTVTLILSLVPLASISVWLLWRWSVREQMRLPRCGSCGYDVRHIMGLTCPECGLDLRQAGIVAPGQAPRLTPIWSALMWLTLYPVPAMVVAYIIVNMLVPWSYQMSVIRQVRTAAPYANTTIYAKLEGSLWSTRSSRPHSTIGLEMSTLRITTDPQQKQPMDLRIDMKTGRYSYTLGGTVTQGQGGLKSAVLCKWLVDSGAFKADQFPQAAAEYLCSYFDEMNTSQGLVTGRQYTNPADPNDKSAMQVPAPAGWRGMWYPPAYVTANSVFVSIDEADSPRQKIVLVTIWIVLWLLSGWVVYMRSLRALSPAPAATPVIADAA
jgi:hypothetical protein